MIPFVNRVSESSSSDTSKIFEDKSKAAQRDAGTAASTEQTASKHTKSGSSERTRIGFVGQALTVGLAISPFAAVRAEEVHADTTTALSIGDGHGSALSQRGALERQSALGGIANRPDSLRRHESAGHDELPRLRINNVELPRFGADDVEHMLQDKKFLERIPSLCQKPEFHKFLGALVKNQNVMDSFRPMYQDQEFVKCVSDLCQKPEFVESLRPLLEDKALMHNLDPIQEHLEKQGISARRILWYKDRYRGIFGF